MTPLTYSLDIISVSKSRRGFHKSRRGLDIGIGMAYTSMTRLEVGDRDSHPTNGVY
jgi:hypothetical protein